MAITDCAAHDAVPTGEITSQPTEPSLIGGIQRDAIGHQRADYLVRRLRVVLLALGLGSTVPNGWAKSRSNGLSFGELTLRQADNLVKALEDIAGDYEPEISTPGPGQLSLFGGGLQ